MKKTIRIMLTLLLLLILLPMSAFAQELAEKAAVLEKLEVISDGQYEQNISRREFAEYVMKMFKITPNNQKTRFSDIDETKDFAAITLYNMGIMTGIDETTFAPDENIRFCDAVAVLVNAMGYKNLAEISGDYQSGYMAIGNELKLYTGISVENYEDAAIKGQLITLLYNTLTAPMQQIKFENGQVQYVRDPDKTVLSEIYNTEKVRGRITGTGFTGLKTVLSLEADEIMFEDVVYTNRVAELNSMLGCYVEVYILTDANDEKSIIAYEAINKSVIVEMDARDIENYSDFTYYYHGEFSKRYRVEKTADVIYNGIVLQDFTDTDFMPDYGRVVLTDSDGNGIYEIVQIFDLQNKIFQYRDSYKVYFKDGTHINTDETKVYISDNEGNTYAWSDLIEWDVLSVGIARDNEHIICYLNDEKISGYVDSVWTRNKEIGYDVKNISYTIAENCYYYNQVKPIIGAWVDIYLDYSGRIAAVVARNGGEYSYAWLIKSYQTDDGESMMLKIFDSRDAEVKRVDVYDKVEIDGERYKTSTQYSEIVYALKLAYAMLQADDGTTIPSEHEVNSYESMGQVVRLAFNTDGLVYKIDTSNQKDNEDSDTLHISPQTKTIATRKVRTAAKSFDDNAICYTADTIMFSIPADENADEDYGMKKGSEFFYDMSIYGQMFSTESNAQADVAVNYEDGNSKAYFNGYDAISVVTQITYAIDPDNDDMATPCIDIVSSGEKKSHFVDLAIVSGSNPIAQDGTVVEPGDAIMFTTNSSGRITGIKMIFDCSNRKITGDFQKTEEAMIRYGSLYEKHGNLIGLMVGTEIAEGQNDKNSVMMYADASGFDVTVVEINKKGRVNARSGSLEEMIDYKTAPYSYSKVIWHSWQGNPRGLVIYKIQNK